MAFATGPRVIVMSSSVPLLTIFDLKGPNLERSADWVTAKDLKGPSVYHDLSSEKIIPISSGIYNISTRSIVHIS